MSVTTVMVLKRRIIPQSKVRTADCLIMLLHARSLSDIAVRDEAKQAMADARCFLRRSRSVNAE
jgi:hypothetical protein